MPAPDPFRGRVAVVTGDAGGSGFAMARAFAARGAKIALADAVWSRFGAAHLVCNNAGIAIAGPLLAATPDD